MARVAKHVLLAMLWLVMSSGCSGCGSDSASDTAAVEDATAEDWRTVLALVDELPHCDIDHRGQLIDLGTGALVGRHTNLLDAPMGVKTTEHDGATWARVFDRKLTLTFYLPRVTTLFVAFRGIGRRSRQVTVSLDATNLGTVKLKRDEIRVASTRVSRLPVDAGLHRLTLRFRGKKKADAAAFAEIDWVRIGVPDELERTYGAPTLGDIIDATAQLANVPHRSLSMRAPGTIRCVVRVPPHARLRTAVGMHGTGRATAAVKLREEGQDPLVLKRVDVTGGPDAAWTELEVSLHAFAGKIVSIELAAAETTGTGRLLIGDPVIEVPKRPPPSVRTAKAAIIVVLNGVERDDLPPWRAAKSPHLPTLNQLVSEATVFHGHRAPSTLVSATMASLLTGLSPRHHTVVDSAAAVPASLSTIGMVAGTSSVTARMFTGVPTSFAAFGFGCTKPCSGPRLEWKQHWDQFTQYPPNEGRMASAPIDDAGAWLEGVDLDDQTRPMLAVVHARGGHPPWEVTPTEAEKLPPAEYAGGLSPRRAAQKLAHTEGRHSRLSDADRERMAALFHASLSRQDEALGRLVRRLKDTGLWDDTLLVITGDVSSARRTLFIDGGDLDEKLLTIPLYVHFPGGRHAGVRVDHATEIYDITRTAFAALDLKAPEDMLGVDLDGVVVAESVDSQRVRAAFLNEMFSARWGDFALRGEIGKSPKFCHLTIDPTCVYDRTYRYPATAMALFTQLARFTSAGHAVPERVRLRLTPEQSGWLDVWGSYYQYK